MYKFVILVSCLVAVAYAGLINTVPLAPLVATAPQIIKTNLAPAPIIPVIKNVGLGWGPSPIVSPLALGGPILKGPLLASPLSLGGPIIKGGAIGLGGW